MFQQQIPHLSADDYQQILSDYPPIISKEQMCHICHLSKRNATYLLQHHLIPCTFTGKATHSYQIETKDVVAFMLQREIEPERFTVSSFTQPRRKSRNFITDDEAATLQAMLTECFTNYPDLLHVSQVCEITGYSPDTINKWCNSGILMSFTPHRAHLIPKGALIDFMTGSTFWHISTKSIKHLHMLGEIKKQLSLGHKK